MTGRSSSLLVNWSYYGGCTIKKGGREDMVKLGMNCRQSRATHLASLEVSP